MVVQLQEEEEYLSKRQKVLSRFSKEFIDEHCNNNMAFRTIMEMLIRDEDPYSIIEWLIEDRNKMMKEVIEVIRSKPYRYGTKTLKFKR